MDNESHPLLAPQTARTTLRVGDRFVMEAEARATPLGLLAAGQQIPGRVLRQTRTLGIASPVG